MVERGCTVKEPPAGAARLRAEDRFSFRCGADLECFTRCCEDVNIVLTPYDILRLKQALRMDSSEFLESFTITPFTPEQKFPIVLLKMDAGRRCPFVQSSGCSVYGNRPWACRMYPVGVAVPDSPAESEFYFVMAEDLCKGHRSGADVSLSQWMRSQGVEQYEMMGAAFRDLTLHPFWRTGRDLTPQQMDMFYMACYDVDRFRQFVFGTRFLQLFDVDEARAEALQTDDEELLELGMHWIRFSIFGERTMKLRRAPAQPEAVGR